MTLGFSVMRRAFAVLAATALLANSAGAATPAPKPIVSDPGEPAFRELFKEMANTNTSFPDGDCTKLVTQVKVRMSAAGYPESDLHIFVPDGSPKSGILVATYPGKDPKAKAILMRTRQIEEPDAYEYLRSQAMKKRVPITVVAAAVIDAHEVLG